MTRPGISFLVGLVALVFGCVGVARALDPPHDASRSIDCSNCHLTHHAVDAGIAKVAGNPNLCMSCHSVGGMAATMPYSNSDEAIPGVSGTSHRWDSGASGWVKPDAANTSQGTVQSSGAFSGRYAKTYTVTISAGGDVGTARFGWSSSKPAKRTYRDQFTAISYAGSDGTLSWTANPWLESGETNDANAGVYRVVANAACASGNCLRIGGGLIGAFSVARPANLSGTTSGMLTFTYRRSLATCPNTSTATVAAQVSSDGTAWVTLATYKLDACDTAQVAQSFDVSAYLAATSQLRFLGTGTTGATDFIYIDNVELAAVAGSAGASNVTTGTAISLDEGVSVSFSNAATSPSFAVNDRWTVYVEPDINQPTGIALAARLASGKVTCSCCHNEHSQVAEPFDRTAPAYPTPGPGGEGRHHQRLDNATNQMCLDCHSARNVTAATQGSHPVGVTIPAGSFKAPATLPLTKTGNAIQCMTCHVVHDSEPVTDGTLRRVSSVNALCSDCHTLADTTSPATHLSSSRGVLWPGPQYGTYFPAVTDVGQRGACTNCHQSHGWPDADTPTQDFPSLLVGREENLCFACHDGQPVTKNVRLQFTKTYRHPTSDYVGRHSTTEGGTSAQFGTANRHAECDDCHNSHTARSDATTPTAPTASNRLLGVSRIAVTNGAAGTVPAYTYRPATDVAHPVLEYETCFKCHSSWTTRPAGQTDFGVRLNSNNPSFHPVEATGKNANIRVNSFVNGWTATKTMYCTDCHTSDDTSVRGPHGSQNRYLLKRPHIASSAARTTASTEECFDCHSFNTYSNTGTSDTVQAYSRFNRPGYEEGHSFHLVAKRAPCYACHDSHGSTTLPHLMVVGRNPGLISYTETTTGGSCTPTCHSTRTYTLNYPR